MINEKIKKAIKKAIEVAQKKGELPLFKLPEVKVNRPTDSRFGDWTTNITLILTGKAKKPPSEIASIIIENLKQDHLFSKIEEKNGFINFSLSNIYWQSQVAEILKKSYKFGQLKTGQNKKIQIEFGSANPTGPLHIGIGRNLFIGDVLANIFKKAGFKVCREYYVNDMGNQIEIFARSVEVRYLEILGQKTKFPKDGYKGDYPASLAQKIVKKHNRKFLKEKPVERLEKFKKLVISLVVKDAKNVCQKAGIEFNQWFFESELHQKNFFKKVINLLEKKRLIYKKDLALWFKTTKFGGDKDDVLIRSDGTATYFGADIAYHYNKLAKRKFYRVINIWGADNSGNVSRLKKAVKELGFEGKLEIVIHQYVKLLEKGKEVDLSKRKGTYRTLEELLDRVGTDVARFFFLMRSPNSHLDFDMDLALAHSKKNPVFYVQYAYARICSILKKITNHKSQITNKSQISNLKLQLLNHPSEIELIKNLTKLPAVLEEITNNPYLIHRLPFYTYSLAGSFHGFYKNCRVISENKELTKARQALILATKIILKDTLEIMGISAPEKM
jgi:arginyl-tRNA synthetase